MRGHSEVLEKADPLLRSKLSSGNQEERLRVVLGLGDESVSRHIPDMQDFGGRSRREARAALIEERKKRIANDINDILHQLDKFPLTIEGGEMSSYVTVEGRAGDIFEALKLQGVRDAHLDRDLTLIRPRKKTLMSL